MTPGGRKAAPGTNRPRAGTPPRAGIFSPADTPPWAVALGAVLVALAAVAVYRGVLPYFFAQDDFEGLARARGLLPRLEGIWRLIGNQYYYDVMAALGGLEPLPYRVASLSLHAATSVLVMFVLLPWASLPAAIIGAVFFATHPALHTSLYWIAAVSSILSVTFALVAILVERTRGPARWLALPLFLLSLLSKETTLGLPLVIAAMRLADRRGLRDALLVALGVVAAGFTIAVAAAGPVDLAAGHAADSPYRVAFGPHIAINLATYLGWCLNSWYVTMIGFADAVEPQAVAAGAAAFALWSLGFLVPGLRHRGWWLGGVWFLALIAPVLLLPNHTYHYYLYGPLIGFSVALAIGWDTLAARFGSEKRMSFAAATVALAVVFTVNGAAVIRKIETVPFMEILRSDPSVDRAIIARNVWRDLRTELLPDGTTLRFWSPTAAQFEARLHPDSDPTQETYWEQNVRAAILNGLGVRVLFPRVDTVTFVRSLDVADPALYAVYRIDGSLAVATSAYLDSMIRVHGGLPGGERE